MIDYEKITLKKKLNVMPRILLDMRSYDSQQYHQTPRFMNQQLKFRYNSLQ